VQSPAEAVLVVVLAEGVDLAQQVIQGWQRAVQACLLLVMAGAGRPWALAGRNVPATTVPVTGACALQASR
jgi:hypothetical protein